MMQKVRRESKKEKRKGNNNNDKESKKEVKEQKIDEIKRKENHVESEARCEKMEQ